MEEENYIRQAIALARTAAGWTNPNPLVGAVIVKDGVVIGTGCHERYGDLHAERNALAACKTSPEGSTIYVTLEPCNHTGKQPPCVDALIEAKVARVVVGSRDPNPLVAGQGNARLRAAGIEVVEDVLREECDAINGIYFHYMTTKTPYVVAKWAMTVDGRIASSTGDSRWVSGEKSRKDVHALRHRLAAIMVGIGTVLSDDPLLTCRDMVGNNPTRIVCDTNLRIPEDCQLVRTIDQAPLIVATASEDDQRIARLEALGVTVVRVPSIDGRTDLASLMVELAKRGIDSVLLEGGGTLNASAFEAGVVDELIVYLAPKIIGGSGAKGPVGGDGIQLMAHALTFGKPEVSALDDDIKLVYKIERSR